jgi:hypothetical protein
MMMMMMMMMMIQQPLLPKHSRPVLADRPAH